MLLYSQDSELRCIKTLTDPEIPERVRSTLLGKLTSEHFFYPPCKAAHKRIATIAKKRFEIMDFEDLVADPSLEEDFRDLLNDSDAKPCRSKKSVNKLVERLIEYKRIRIVYNMANDALDNLDSEKLDIELLLDKITDQIVGARRDNTDEQHIVRIGAKGNADELVSDVLNRVAEELIKTGFAEYDDKNGGLPEEGVMIIAATTSGGKTAVLMNLMVNLYLLAKKKVLRVSLEMGDRQEMARFLSNVSKVPFYKIKQHKLSLKEKQRIKQEYKKFKKFGRKHGCQFDTVSPTRNMTIDDVFRMVKPYQYDVIGIDYISLLDGVDVDNQWQALSAIARDAKIFSRENKCLVILLCQLDDESDKLRYSKGIKEHADVMWQWNYSKQEQRELKVLPVKVGKARDGELFGFELQEKFECMRVESMSSDRGEYGNSSSEVDVSGSSSDDDSPEEQHNDYALE